MCECKLILLSAFVWCNVILVTPFNIDNSNYAVFTKESSSMFGFTVAVHKDRSDRAWVLVGAPEAQSVYQDSRFVSKGGAVYNCSTDTDNRCDEIPFDRGNYNTFGNKPLDKKSEQWFGATLGTSGQTHGPIVACAPRYVWFTKDFNRRDPVGTCFVSDGAFQNIEEYSPCRTMNWGYHRQGSCQAGFSAGINGVGDRLYVGAPGSYYWQGQLYSIDAHAHFNFTPGVYGHKGYGAKGSVHQQSLENRPAVFSTREGKLTDDDSYMGYSIVVGHFQAGERYEGIAVGMPRGNALRGKVLLFTWDLRNYKNITVSKQIGSYFGYSITTADVNGDKKLDIIVGAPMHTERNNDLKYDVGRIYIFYQSSNFAESFNTFHSIDGIDSKSRFGHSVSTLGDLNLDGYDDFAVGAPYAGKDGRGAVYIYYGSAEGKPKKFKQAIYAKEIESSIPTSAFGFSIAGGMDLNGDDYPDMAVGAYLSDSAFFFRSRPVVLVDAYVRFQTPNKQIDIKQKCRLPTGADAPCTAVEFCIKYTGKGIPDELHFMVEYILDSLKPINASRINFVTRRTSRFQTAIHLYKDRPANCITERVYIINSNMRDKLTPLEAQMKYSLVQNYPESKIRNPRSVLRPVLDLNSPPSRKDSITVQKNCGSDNICIPDLVVNVVPNVNEYVLDSDTKLQLDVTVSNLGEDSFETTFYIKLPKGIYYNYYETTLNMSGITCNTFNDTNLLKCDVGNPLPGGKIALFKIVLQPKFQEEMTTSYIFDAFVNSTNPEFGSSLTNNRQHFSVRISINASLELTGDSYPATVYYNNSLYTSEKIVRETDIGPQVTHVYHVTNTGTATIPEAEVFIVWPQKTLNGKDLLYQLDEPHTLGNVKCDSGTANYEKYLLNRYVESIWNRLKIDTSNVEQTAKDKQKTDNRVNHTITQTNINTQTSETKVTETGGGVSSGIGVQNKNVLARPYNENNINSQGTLNARGEYVYTESRSKTEIGPDGQPHTVWTNITTVRDPSGHILNTSYSNQFYGTADSLGSSQSNSASESREFRPVQSGGQNTFSHSSQSGSDFTTAGQTLNQDEGGVARQQQTRYHGQHRQDGSGQQGGVYESKFHKEYAYQVGGGPQEAGTLHGQSGSEGRLHTGYYDEGGIYPDYPRDNSGRTVYNKTYNVQRTHSIPIDIPEGQNNQYYGTQVTPLGRGFTVQTLDIDNGAEEASLYGAQRGGLYGGRSESSQSSNRFQEEVYRHRQEPNQEGSYSREWRTEGGYSQGGQFPFAHNSVERDNVPTDTPNPRYRNKRMTQNGDYTEIKDVVGCKNCQYIRCVVKNLPKRNQVSIALRSRLNVREVKNLTSTQPIKISSVIIGKISKLPQGGRPSGQALEKHEVVTIVPAQEVELVPDVAPLWIYVVSAVIGVIIVLLLMWLLNKCGFFRRNRPSSGPERQPLNRNGYHSGDEAL